MRTRSLRPVFLLRKSTSTDSLTFYCRFLVPVLLPRTDHRRQYDVTIWWRMLDAIIIHRILSCATAWAGREHRDHCRFLRPGENIVIQSYRIAGEYGLQQTKRWRQRKLDAIVNYRIYPKTIASVCFLHNKSTGLMYYRWFSVTILLPRPSSTQNRPNTVLRLLPSIKNLYHPILIFNKIPCIFFKYSHNF